MTHTKHPRGITLVEIAVGIGVFVLLIGLVAPTYAMLRGNVALGNGARELQSSLRLAQNRAAVSQGGEAHGVRINTDSYAMFGGSSWDARTYTEQHSLPSGVTVTTGANQTILFTRLTGMPAAAQDVVLSAGSNTRTVSVGAGGLVSLP